ncbi:prolipoprotein diacylglyceryl transferase [Serpentinicella alkaliphila]|uniref:Phosphatidylglycerol--prolipoprotein diacylglyceryl transferase n=1 Tax=Serpentinicella alkaliphila TaxID=1734049 RepID=A0A4R2TVI6_9FIRM|nr:prolipoprotein diacylglyceryl transferase [Serpentinicella alkaliphila]QUH26780.1 prolipoprotein diacylglyceryl transferase [Serpentinicella alkaliphila]TCQ08000.1 phosphatidylglycerol:prolipoprotein diacylglycerol transferase [Serpentinicella alkaliphila]
MDPIAFEFFGIQVAWYGIIISIGIILGVIVATKRAVKVGLHEETIIDMCLIAIPLAIIGARAYYVIFKWDYYSQNIFQIFKIREGGLAIHGAVLAGVLGGYLFCKYRKIDFLTLADVCAPSIILGQAIGRWGNYFNQEAYGRPTDLPWAIEINGEMVHPTFFYESMWNFVVFIFLIYYTKKKKYNGQIFLLYLALYSLGRFFIEGLRTDSLMIGPLRVAQLISISLILIAVIGMKVLNSRKNTY